MIVDLSPAKQPTRGRGSHFFDARETMLIGLKRRDARATISLLGALVHKLFSKKDRSVSEHVNHKRILVCTRNLLGDRETGRSPKSRSLRAFGIFRISTGCSSAEMANLAGLASGRNLKHRTNHGRRALGRRARQGLSAWQPIATKPRR
jgi:hypothetical protein